jgi:cytochrome P450
MNATQTRALVGEAPASAAGPVDDTATLRLPPNSESSALRQTIAFGARPLAWGIESQRKFGDVWQLRLLRRDVSFVVSSHPDHAKALFTADPSDAPSMTGESPLRPILGPNSVLTLTGDQHMRQRKLLLPSFHGESVQRYVEMINDVAAREVSTWSAGRSFALAPRMQAVTLDVIMAGIFGIDGPGEPGSPEASLRASLQRILGLSKRAFWGIVDLRNIGRAEPRGILRRLVDRIDRDLYAVIAKRKREPLPDGAADVFSLLLAARDEDGRALTDHELRDELATLVLAGHETTANALAWTFDLLLHSPRAYDRLRESVRNHDPQADDYIEAVINEGMRMRPVVPLIVRKVNRSWQLGDFVVPAGTPVAMSIVGLHHREDLYPRSHEFLPERFLGHKPGTYTWIGFGGGIRRCLGATLALAEQRAVIRTIAANVDLGASDERLERAVQRNVTMIPRHGCRVLVKQTG